MGGAVGPYEFANGMARRGHSVHVVHLRVGEDRIEGLADLPWISFEAGIQHRFTDDPPTMLAGLPPRRDPDEPALPDADFIAAWHERCSRRHGLPFVFVQGFQMFAPEVEEPVFRAPCPKICVAKWLVEAGKQMRVAAHELIHVPYGLDHDKYRLVSPIEDRPPLVSMAYHNMPQKGPAEGLAVLDEVKTRIPDVEAVVFSPKAPVHETPPWITVVTDPPQDVLVNEIYNRSRIFLCPSRVEGFGFPCIEAMACGAALVTTSNGGSGDYAIDGETALVCEARDVSAMADHVVGLLRDDEHRVRLARQGRDYVRKTFDWDVSAEKLERFLDEYATDPGRYTERY